MKHRDISWWKVLLVSVFPCLLLLSPLQAQGETALVSEEGTALPIIISTEASPDSKQAAQTLAEYLGRMSGVTFEVRSGDGTQGIVVGQAGEFTSIKNSFDASKISDREAYLLRSHKQGVFLVGATAKGVRHAVWDFLQRLGYRRFFPGENWEIIPKKARLRIDIDVEEKPEFLLRDLFFNHSSWPDNLVRWDEWQEVNRIGKSISLNTAHAWDSIQKQHQAEFDAHPEYFALIKGERKTKGARLKFCLSNPGLRQLIARYAIGFFDKNPHEDTVSIEPSDSAGWCECEPCQAIGSPSDRMVVLANDVIDALQSKHPQKQVAFYAYSHHAAKPKITLKPGAIVSVTTALRKGNQTFEQLIDGWREQGATTGIRDYMSFTAWEGYDTPYYSRAARVEEYVRALAGFSQLPDKYYRAEMGDNWGPNGLGHYLAARILWDSSEADRVDELIDDFLEKSFGEAQEPMRKFYALINGLDQTFVPPFGNGTVHALYQILDEAWKSTSDEGAHSRLGDLILYVRYLEQYQQFLQAPREQKQKYFEQILRYAYRIRSTHMVHSRALYLKQFAGKFGAEGTIPKNAAATIPEEENPWKSSEPFSTTEILDTLSSGVKATSVPEKSWKVSLVSAPKQAPIPVEFHTRGPSRIMLYFPKDGEAQIMPRKMSGSIFNDPRNYHVRDTTGKVVGQGAVKNNVPIKIQGKAHESYEFFVFIHNYGSSQKFEISGSAAAAVQTDLDHGRLHLFQDPAKLYVYVPAEAKQWDLTLETFTPGETAKVTVISPDGKVAGTIETIEEKKKEQTFFGQEGFWQIAVDEAHAGLLYSVGLTIDPTLSPWVSLDQNYLLKIQ